MKKIMSVIIIILLVVSIGIISSASTASVKVKVNGIQITFPDEQPYVNADNRTMVPVRFVTQAMDCDVKWEDANQLVIITKGEKRILLQIGQNWAIINDTKTDIRKEFDTKAILKNDRTMVPLRFVSETLGAGVAWDEVNNMVIIRSDGVVEPVATPTPTPAATPVSWRNVEVPMTFIETESDAMPEGFILPQFIIKHDPDGFGGYFSIELQNIHNYTDVASDYACKITCLNYDLINTYAGMTSILRYDTLNNLSRKFGGPGYVTPTLWVSPSQDKKYTDMPELGEVKIHPGVVLEMQVEFYYAGLKQIYRDNVELKQK